MGMNKGVEDTEYPIVFSCTDMFIHDGEQLVMIKKKGRDKLYLPGGFQDVTDFTVKHCAIRETEEEVGLEIKPEAFIRVGEFLTCDTHRYNPEISKHRLRTTLFAIDTEKQLVKVADAVAGDDAESVHLVSLEKLFDVDWAVKNITAGHVALIFACLPYVTSKW